MFFGAIEGILSHFVLCWLKKGGHSVVSSEKKAQILPLPGIEPGPWRGQTLG